MDNKTYAMTPQDLATYAMTPQHLATDKRQTTMIFFLLILLLGGKPTETIDLDVEVSCDYLENCVLPCKFNPGTDPVIHWTKEPEESRVHDYYYGKSQSVNQHENYRGRTSLFNDLILTGNASLLLQKVTVQDEGRYKCYVDTVSPYKITELYVNLKVNNVEVSCDYLENCVLPCSFNPGTDPVIHWTKEPEDWNLHSYYHGKSQTVFQHENYRGRTSLFNDLILTGNASLLLQKVTVQDEGRYKCYVNTVSPDKITELYVNLKVYIFSVICDPSSVETPFGQTAVLNCHVTPPHDLSKETVQWKVQSQNGKDVDLMLNGEDDLSEQDEQFKGRTKLHKEGLSKGNIKLGISSVSPEDSGTYTCLVTINDVNNVPHTQTGTVTLLVSSKDKRVAPSTTGQIVGGVVGGVVGVLLLIVVIVVPIILCRSSNRLPSDWKAIGFPVIVGVLLLICGIVVLIILYWSSNRHPSDWIDGVAVGVFLVVAGVIVLIWHIVVLIILYRSSNRHPSDWKAIGFPVIVGVLLLICGIVVLIILYWSSNRHPSDWIDGVAVGVFLVVAGVIVLIWHIVVLIILYRSSNRHPSGNGRDVKTSADDHETTKRRPCDDHETTMRRPCDDHETTVPLQDLYDITEEQRRL